MCARGDGIRRSKDLRAGLRKYLRPTNERKIMSKKTVKQRIALVAASALTAGFISVVSAPIANAAAIASGEVTLTTSTTSAGICAVDTTAAAQVVTATTNRDFVLTIASGGTTDTVYMVTAGSVRVKESTFSGTDQGVTDTTAYAVGSTYGTSALQGDTVTVQTTNTVGTGTVTIKGTSTGSSVEIITFNVVASCANNVLDLAESKIQVRDDVYGATSNADEAAGTTVVNNGTSYINLDLRDSYAQPLSGAGVLAASATNGAVINWDSTPSVQSSVAYLPTRGATGTELFVVQGTANKDKPLTTVVSITLDGAPVATKTIKFTGVPSKILVKDVTVGKVGALGYFKVKVQDSAGNDLGAKTVTSDSTANAAATVTPIVSAVDDAVTADDGDWSALADGNYSCVKSGTATITVKTTISSVAGTSVKQTIPVACGGALDTWTISMDKASYAPGEVATLTVTGKDSFGFPVNTNDILGTAGVDIEDSFGGMTFVSAPTGGDKFSSAAGVKTYTLSVGTTEGSFVGSFKIAGATDTSAKTVQYKIASATPGVSNADVLKSIVALIASINKQIQALQKLILRR